MCSPKVSSFTSMILRGGAKILVQGNGGGQNFSAQIFEGSPKAPRKCKCHGTHGSGGGKIQCGGSEGGQKRRHKFQGGGQILSATAHGFKICTVPPLP